LIVLSCSCSIGADSYVTVSAHEALLRLNLTPLANRKLVISRAVTSWQQLWVETLGPTMCQPVTFLTSLIGIRKTEV